MKVRNVLISAVAILFVINLTGCGSREYSDVKEVLSAQINAVDKYVSAIKKAENAQDVASAINCFSNDMKKVIPEMKNVMKKYPELADKEALPDDLKVLAEKMKSLSGRLQETTMKTMEYMQDPDVQKAMEDQGEIMMEMAKE